MSLCRVVGEDPSVEKYAVNGYGGKETNQGFPQLLPENIFVTGL